MKNLALILFVFVSIAASADSIKTTCKDSFTGQEYSLILGSRYADVCSEEAKGLKEPTGDFEEAGVDLVISSLVCGDEILVGYNALVAEQGTLTLLTGFEQINYIDSRNFNQLILKRVIRSSETDRTDKLAQTKFLSLNCN